MNVYITTLALIFKEIIHCVKILFIINMALQGSRACFLVSNLIQYYCSILDFVHKFIKFLITDLGRFSYNGF